MRTVLAVVTLAGVLVACSRNNEKSAQVPTEEGVRTLVESFWNDLKAGDWEALYAHASDEYRDQCYMSDMRAGMQAALAYLSKALETASVHIENIRVLGSEAYYNVSILDGDEALTTASDTRVVFEDGRWVLPFGGSC